MLNNSVLENIVIDYKNNNLNNSNYTGYEIYKEIIPKYIFDNIVISGTFTSSSGTVTPNIISSKNTFTNLSLSKYPTLSSFCIDFENKLLSSMTFTNTAGTSKLAYKIPLKLSNEMINSINSNKKNTYESIIGKFCEIIIDNIKNNTILITNSISGNYISNSIT